MWMLVWEEGLIALTEAQLGGEGMTFLQLHEPPPLTQSNPPQLTPSALEALEPVQPAAMDRAQLWPELRRISLMLPCFCPQPSWGCAALWPGESRDSKKRRICFKRRRRILSVLLFLTGKKKTGQRAKVQSNCRFESHFRNLISVSLFVTQVLGVH